MRTLNEISITLLIASVTVCATIAHWIIPFYLIVHFRKVLSRYPSLEKPPKGLTKVLTVVYRLSMFKKTFSRGTFIF